jgi:hypothetical protein
MTESRLPGGDAAVTTEDEPVKAAGRFRTALPQVWVEDKGLSLNGLALINIY